MKNEFPLVADYQTFRVSIILRLVFSVMLYFFFATWLKKITPEVYYFFIFIIK